MHVASSLTTSLDLLPSLLLTASFDQQAQSFHCSLAQATAIDVRGPEFLVRVPLIQAVEDLRAQRSQGGSLGSSCELS